ncbi:unnamed protein product, partial [Dovyalis caffra]
TARAIIDVSDGKLVLRVGDEKVTFLISKSMRHSLEHDDKCYFIDAIDTTALESMREIIYDDRLKLCMIQGEENDGDDPIRVEQVARPKANEFMIRKKEFEEIDER